MPSSATARNRLEKMAAGENLNTWGDPRLNTDLDLIDALADGWTIKALTGNATLTSTNYTTDEARSRVLKFTGAGPFTVTIPSVEKWYHVWNACTAALTITTGAGDAVTLAVGEVAPIICDASNVKRVKVIDYGSDNVSSSAVPTSANHFTNKAYVDGLAFAAVNLPGQNAGTVNQFIKSNGTTASWETISVADVTGAAPLASPSFTGDATLAGSADIGGALDVTGAASIGGELTVSGGVDQVGGSKAGVTAIASTVIDFSANDCQTKSISANTAFTVTGLEAGKLQVVVLILTITSSAVPSFPAAFDFQDGLDFLSSLGNGKHWLTIASADGGTSGVIGLLYRNVS